MLKDKKGMTMVEIIVAFAILLIGLSMLYKTTVFSLQQIQKADKIQSEVDELLNGYYLNQDEGKSAAPQNAAIEIDGKSAGNLQFYTADYENDGYHIYSFIPTGE